MNCQISFDSTNRQIEPTPRGWFESLTPEEKAMSVNPCLELPEKLRLFGVEWANADRLVSLYLNGVSGSGKTTFAFSVILKALKVWHNKGYFFPYRIGGKDLSDSLLEATLSGGDKFILEKFTSTELLFIDDIDKVHVTERFRGQIFHIIDKRYLEDKPTIITSNSQPDQLSAILDSAILSRMSNPNKWKIIGFPNKDLRPMQIEYF